MAKAATKVSIFAGTPRTRGSSTSRSVTEAKEVALKGIRDLKACKRLEAVFHSLAEEIGGKIKNAMTTIFVEQGCEKKIKPENFDAFDEDQTANCQLRLRSYGVNGIDDDAAAEIEAAGLGDLIEEKLTYEFDQDKLTPHIMEQIDEALSKIKGLPEGLVIPRLKRSLDKRALEMLFARHYADKAFIESALKLTGTLAIRCNYNKADTDIRADIERVTTHVFPDTAFADAIQKAATDPEAALNPRKPSKKAKAA